MKKITVNELIRQLEFFRDHCGAGEYVVDYMDVDSMEHDIEEGVHDYSDKLKLVILG